jgi:hypothetical protein
MMMDWLGRRPGISRQGLAVFDEIPGPAPEVDLALDSILAEETLERLEPDRSPGAA